MCHLLQFTIRWAFALYNHLTFDIEILFWFLLRFLHSRSSVVRDTRSPQVYACSAFDKGVMNYLSVTVVYIHMLILTTDVYH